MYRLYIYNYIYTRVCRYIVCIIYYTHMTYVDKCICRYMYTTSFTIPHGSLEADAMDGADGSPSVQKVLFCLAWEGVNDCRKWVCLKIVYP
jgi:hypothetical protein